MSIDRTLPFTCYIIYMISLVRLHAGIEGDDLEYQEPFLLETMTITINVSRFLMC